MAKWGRRVPRRGRRHRDLTEDSTIPAVNLDASDAAELAEMLQFLHDWLLLGRSDSEVLFGHESE